MSCHVRSALAALLRASHVGLRTGGGPELAGPRGSSRGLGLQSAMSFWLKVLTRLKASYALSYLKSLVQCPSNPIEDLEL